MIDSYPIYTWNHDARMIFESSTRSACMAGDVVCEIVTQMTSSFALQTICCKQNYAQFFSIRTEALKIEMSSFAFRTICCKQNYAQKFVASNTSIRNRDVRAHGRAWVRCPFGLACSMIMYAHIKKKPFLNKVFFHAKCNENLVYYSFLNTRQYALIILF